MRHGIWSQTVAIVGVAAIGGATAAVLIAAADGLSTLADVAFVGAWGAIPASMMGVWLALFYRRVSRGQLAVALLMGSITGAACFCVVLWSIFSGMGE
jgi:hypothetical protein